MAQAQPPPSFKLGEPSSKLLIPLFIKALGQIKLEYTIEKAVFLAPKVYGIEDENGKTILKIKCETSKAIEVMKNNNN